MSPSTYRRRGFTLVEMLIVVSVILLLLGITVPSLHMAKEYANAAECKANLRRMVDLMQTNQSREPGKIAPSAGWINFVLFNGGASLVRCPKDDREHDLATAIDGGIENLYIVQVSGGKTMFSYLEDVINGRETDDPQIIYNPGPGTRVGEGWLNLPRPESNQALVCMDNDAGVLFTFEADQIVIQSLDAPGDTSCGSDHWVCQGRGGDNWQNEILVRLTGNGYQNKVDPTYYLKTGAAICSYGANLAVPRRARPTQALLMDANEAYLEVDPSGNYIEDIGKLLAPRHFAGGNMGSGRLYYARVDASVQEATAMEMEYELDKWLNEGQLDALYPNVPKDRKQGQSIWEP